MKSMICRLSGIGLVIAMAGCEMPPRYDPSRCLETTLREQSYLSSEYKPPATIKYINKVRTEGPLEGYILSFMLDTDIGIGQAFVVPLPSGGFRWSIISDNYARISGRSYLKVNEDTVRQLGDEPAIYLGKLCIDNGLHTLPDDWEPVHAELEIPE